MANVASWTLRELTTLAAAHAAAGLLPVVSIVVREGVVLATTPMQPRVHLGDHGEMRALAQAGDARGATLVTTVRPCLVCYAAAHRCGIRDVLYVLDAPDTIPDGAYHALRDVLPDAPTLSQAGDLAAMRAVFARSAHPYAATVLAWASRKSKP